MQWVRTNRRFGAWCALMAIALQIVLSFGHAHRIEGFRGAMGVPGGLLQAAAATGVRTMVEQADPASKPAGLAFDYCAICAVIKMGAATVAPEAPVAGVPVMAGGMRLAPHAEAAVRTLAHLLFQARAPPAA
jgi:hypothetical protein